MGPTGKNLKDTCKRRKFVGNIDFASTSLTHLKADFGEGGFK